MNNAINIEEIMKEIRQEIVDKHLTPDMLSFEDVPFRKPEQSGEAGWGSPETHNALLYLNSHHTIQPYKELGGNPLAVFLKKVIRKLVKFYIEPIAAEQSTFNANVVHLFNALDGEQSGSADLQALVSRLDVLELQMKQLETENAALRKQLEDGNA